MKPHRTFKPEFNARVVLQRLTGTKSAAHLCREHSLSDQLLSNWKKPFIDHAGVVFATPGATTAEQERMADLERLVGRLTLELEAAKKSCRLSRQSPGEARGDRSTRSAIPSHAAVRVAAGEGVGAPLRRILFLEIYIKGPFVVLY
jgi:transposase-like protein